MTKGKDHPGTPRWPLWIGKNPFHTYVYIYTIIINYTHTIHTDIYIYIHTYIHMSMHMQCQPWIHKPLPAV